MSSGRQVSHHFSEVIEDVLVLMLDPGVGCSHDVLHDALLVSDYLIYSGNITKVLAELVGKTEIRKNVQKVSLYSTT